MTEQSITPKQAAEFVSALCKRLIQNVEIVVVGKRQVITSALVALLTEGHILIEDVPGVAKTVLAKSIARSVGCSFQRVQCTPDLLPADITGISVFNQQSGQFEFRPGPAFANVLLTDELNRATPRTQSALLECMAEGQITVDGVTRPLAKPFLVFATQNPIDTLTAACVGKDIVRAQTCCKMIYVHDEVRKYIVKIVRATRGHGDLAVGASPRASLALFRSAQALAALNNWEYVLPDFVKIMAPMVLEHRVVLKPESRLLKRNAAQIIWDIVEKMPAPAPKK